MNLLLQPPVGTDHELFARHREDISPYSLNPASQLYTILSPIANLFSLNSRGTTWLGSSVGGAHVIPKNKQKTVKITD